MTSSERKSFGQGNPDLADYVDSLFQWEDEILQEVRVRAEKAKLPPIHVGPSDGRILELLSRMIGAKKIVEIGSLAGYSAICLGRGMGRDGTLYCLEFDPRHSEITQESLQHAGLSSQTKVLTGAALDLLPKIESDGPFDIVFIDADKRNYPNYFKWAEKNLRIGGLILGDNTFAFGHVHEKDIGDERLEKQVQAIDEFNRLVARSPHFRGTVFPTGEGLTVGVRI